ncbi:predicted protein [Histoplasma capsulatum var. duboisii H88]|uniref:Predicted protein n=2 Tax=Ajellomyces capsulatus TaxID=5037 RepID=F0US01_AJEC8|nr:predicted protein [Histoplasma capsulatum H143]EGC48678.1 predicted protein [Histoplasma capsulatum var. duboisii H88]
MRELYHSPGIWTPLCLGFLLRLKRGVPPGGIVQSRDIVVPRSSLDRNRQGLCAQGGHISSTWYTWTAVKRDAYTLRDSANGHSVHVCCQAMVCNAKSGTSLMSSPSLLQADKLNAAEGKSFVSVVDAIKWFYQ